MKSIFKFSDDKKSSIEWAKELKVDGLFYDSKDRATDPLICVLDPDGWDRKNFEKSLREKISRSEFYRRVSRSTVSCDKRNIEKFFSKLSESVKDDI